jgi:tol-pal system protein YbgF
MGVAVCLSLAAPAFAESAPVFDADAVQDDGVGEQAYLPPPPAPPAPDQESGSTFVPMQAQPQPEQQQVVSNDAARVDTLQSEIQSLRGQVEQLTHQLDQVKNQQKTAPAQKVADEVKSAATEEAPAPKSLSARNNAASVNDGIQADNADGDDLSVATPPKLETPAKPVLIKTSKKQTISSETKAQPNVAEEQQIYQTAYNLIKARRYNDAVSALQGMLRKYPSGQFASNAHYWLGELYGLMGKNDQALNEFTVVVDNYPESPRVSDAQLKVGLLLASQLKWPEAKSALKKVINHYPGSASARLAAEQLKQIKIAGH